MGWSEKYKKSIDCSNPKGFSQKSHCQGREKRLKEHCGCDDQIVKELEIKLKKLDDTSYDSIDKLMRKIMKKHGITAKQLHNAFVNKHNKTPDDWIENLNEGTLHHWFKGSKSKGGKPGWVQADGSPCANEPGETSTPKCFSSARLASLKRKGEEGESLIKSAVRRKRQQDKNQQLKSGAAKPTMVKTFVKGKEDPNYIKAEPGIKESMELKEAQKDIKGKNSGKKDACYHKVKSRYDVWPSAYASGALVKCRKVGAKNWGTKSEEVQMMRYCPKCKKVETRDMCKYGSKCWDMFSIPEPLSQNQRKYSIATVHPGNFAESSDHEYSMARSQLSTIISAAKRLRRKMKGEGNIEAWVQSKITKASDYLDSAADYVDSGEMKAEQYSNWRADFGLSEDWQKVNRKDKTDGLSQAAVDAYRRENPGSKLQTAVTEKKPTGKRAKRRANFCRRMKGMKSKLTSAETARDPDSRINKALRRWNCN